MTGTHVIVRYALLWSLGIYLRLTILIVPPLAPRLENLLGFSTGEVALATSLPALLIGLGALAGGWLVGRMGVLVTLLAGLTVVALGSAARSVPGGFALFLLATVVMGAGVALLQTAMPRFARAALPQRIGRATAIYTNGLLTGELIAAGGTGWLISWFLGEAWRLAFTVWVLPVPLIALGVALLGRERRGDTPAQSATRAEAVLWREPLVWKTALLLGSAGSLYFTGNVFVSTILQDTGRSAMLDASLAALNGTQLLSSLVLVVFADRLLGRRWPLVLVLCGASLGALGMTWLPGPWIGAAAGLLGFCTSATLTLALAMPAWLVPVERVAGFAAGALCIGYCIVFVAPVLAGWLEDLTGSATVGFAPLLALALVTVALTGGFRPRTR
ncbi:MFS transporter [Ectothiorhodospiraceae bacterium WFHF3C12]|nr:MFS transporter [Ectothiorhodospiraceae bacterium WFHF3C12]